MFEEVPEQLRIADHIRRTPQYDHCKIFIDGIFEIANKFQLSLKDLPSPKSLPPVRHPAFRAMLGLVAQNLRSLIMIAKAASEGFVEDMEVIRRVMYERHLSVLLIGADPEIRGLQYLRSYWISQLRWLERSEDPTCDVHLEEVLTDTERIREEADRFMKDYFPGRIAPPRYWHGMKMAAVAKVVGWKYPHELGYGYLSEYAHAQGYSIPVDRASTPTGVVRNCPSSELVSSITSAALALFLWGWAELARRFQPGELDEIKTLLRHYAREAIPNGDTKIDL